MEKQLFFALDIGTRSVIGLVGEQTGNAVKIIMSDRQEHHTRAMLDGQIHDVMEVASILDSVKKKLESTCGPLKKVSVAAAGRALCTIRSAAEIEVPGRILSLEDEHALELAAIQAAQHQLATSHAVADPTLYYCVGYSVVSFRLDNTTLKSLVGQRGKKAGIELIATFLPRQVIDSLQSAIQTVGLEMATLTLEPIAAISVLIPPTMRHLNLTLVDVGAGTSDVAITREGSVIGFGMVPCAGDEITEAISQKYLLDFNVAEKVKRQLNGKNKKISFTDVLGCSHKIPSQEIAEAIATDVGQLAQAIAAQILELNSSAPQAVLLVGGGALTPMLPEALAQALDVPASRVGIRRPETIEGLINIPDSLRTPDAVTPLGILRLSGSRTLNFVNVTLNDTPLHLFNLGNLTVADALLATGIDIRSLHGRPGLGLTVNVNGQTKFIPGTHGKPGSIQLNGNPAAFTDPIAENDVLTVTPGIDGQTPAPAVKDMLAIPAPYTVIINHNPYEIKPLITVNGQPASEDTLLTDRDDVSCLLPSTLKEVLSLTGNVVSSAKYIYTINGTERHYSVSPQQTIRRSGREIPAHAATPVKPDDHIQFTLPSEPTIAELLGLDVPAQNITVLFNGKACAIPTVRHSVSLNGKPASPDNTAPSGSVIDFSSQEQHNPMVSDALLAAKFDPRSLPPNAKVTLLLNKKPAEYTNPLKNGDKLDIIIE
ncbi:hypothetical protein P22_3699 [Propionispora sp. 2/2-37]|uniref:cell division protein FtsA n=1 Tax=Propionispora sp. 2/2-37 TaxID=1677858 RepID=UPI0006BB5A18|nr:cell division FtsA domain-containing protein [Propionispora sp. 2/2-37]CUH97568.1 hypothetical protein P22_3699 [Propionispora sp. 2/2-37]